MLEQIKPQYEHSLSSHNVIWCLLAINLVISLYYLSHAFSMEGSVLSTKDMFEHKGPFPLKTYHSKMLYK